MLTRPVPGAPSGDDLTIWFGGQPIRARTGDSVAVALLAAGITTTRASAVSGAPRGPFCMMGACFDCLAEVNGRPNVQTCMMQERDGMRIEPLQGVRTLGTQ